MEETKRDKLQLLIRRVFLIITDIILINGCVLLALVMRFDVNIASIEPQYIDNVKDTWLIFTIMTLIIFWVFRMYHSLWQYASIAELYKIVEACVVADVAYLAMTAISGKMLPRSCYFTAGVFMTVAMCTSRFMYRIIRTLIQNYRWETGIQLSSTPDITMWMKLYLQFLLRLHRQREKFLTYVRKLHVT